MTTSALDKTYMQGKEDCDIEKGINGYLLKHWQLLATFWDTHDLALEDLLQTYAF